MIKKHSFLAEFEKALREQTQFTQNELIRLRDLKNGEKNNKIHFPGIFRQTEILPEILNNLF